MTLPQRRFGEQSCFTASKSESGTSVGRSRGLRLVDVPDSDLEGYFWGEKQALDLLHQLSRTQYKKTWAHGGMKASHVPTKKTIERPVPQRLRLFSNHFHPLCVSAELLGISTFDRGDTHLISASTNDRILHIDS